MPEALFTRRFVSLWVFQCATFFSLFQLLPTIPLRIIDLGGNTATAGQFLFWYTIASAAFAPVMGSVADRVGRRRMLVITSLLFVVFSLLYGVIPSLSFVFVIAVVHGALWSGILSAAGAIMTDFIPASRRTEGLAYWGLAPTAGMAIGPAVGMATYKALGWFAVCASIAAISLITAIWASRLQGGTTRSTAALGRFAFWDWRVFATSLSLGVVAFGQGGITTHAVLLAHQRHITPDWLFFAAYAVSTILLRLVVSRFGDRYGPKVLLYPSFVILPLGYAVLAHANGRADVILSAALLGAGMGTAFPAFMTFVVMHSPADQRARTFGSVILAFDTGIGIGSLAIGTMAERASYAFAFDVAAALACLSIPIFLVASRGLVQGTAVAENAPHAGT